MLIPLREKYTVNKPGRAGKGGTNNGMKTERSIAWWLQKSSKVTRRTGTKK